MAIKRTSEFLGKGKQKYWYMVNGICDVQDMALLFLCPFILLQALRLFELFRYQCVEWRWVGCNCR